MRGWPGSPSRFDSDPSSPGNWNTIVAPGTSDPRTFDVPISPPPSDHDSRRATVSGELEGVPEQLATPEESLFEDPSAGRPTQSLSQPPELGSTPPTEVIPAHIEPYSTPPINPVAANTTPQPPIESYQQIPPPTRPAAIPTQLSPPQVVRNVAPPPPPVASAPPPQLTPKQIAQAQKHCRYAISALDYEDFERARQDLLDALKIIGG